MAQQKRYRIVLDISSERYLTHYAGLAHSVATYTIDGRTIKFPATLLRSVVTHNGIHGIYELVTDANNKFQSIHKIGELPR